MRRFVQFGAGNIGRSFIGRLFSEAGFEVVFVDIDRRIVDALNERKSYTVVVKCTGRPDEPRTVGRVRAIDGRDMPSVVNELVHADYMATSVGIRALPSLLPVIARGLIERNAADRGPLDIIIAENMRSGASWFRERLAPLLTGSIAVDDAAGFIETSIGKMVPVMPEAALAEDPLVLFTEPYDTLIVHRKGFLTAVPPLEGIKAVENIAAWVDRKLYMHNMSHAAAAYLAYRADPSLVYLWQAMECESVTDTVRKALGESSAALLRTYPDEFTSRALAEHGEDLLARYRNRALGDTLHRVGRDLGRKLAKEDRLVGACLLASRLDLPFDSIAEAVRAAFSFRAPDENGKPFPGDAAVTEAVKREGPAAVLRRISGLDPNLPVERRVLEACVSGSMRR